jgi:UDP-N-acetylglucosamine 4-epimerase
MIKKLIGLFDREVLEIIPAYGQNRAGDIPHSQASIEKAKRLLGYRPTHSVSEGMSEAIKWYRDNL